jgi:hypothetical protein
MDSHMVLPVAEYLLYIVQSTTVGTNSRTQCAEALCAADAKLTNTTQPAIADRINSSQLGASKCAAVHGYYHPPQVYA